MGQLGFIGFFSQKLGKHHGISFSLVIVKRKIYNLQCNSIPHVDFYVQPKAGLQRSWRVALKRSHFNLLFFKVHCLRLRPFQHKHLNFESYDSRMAARLVSWALATSGPTTSLTKGNAGRATMQAWAVRDEFAVFHQGNHFQPYQHWEPINLLAMPESLQKVRYSIGLARIYNIVPKNLNKDVYDLWDFLHQRIQTFNAFGTTGGICPQNRPRNSNTFSYQLSFLPWKCWWMNLVTWFDPSPFRSVFCWPRTEQWDQEIWCFPRGCSWFGRCVCEQTEGLRAGPDHELGICALWFLPLFLSSKLGTHQIPQKIFKHASFVLLRNRGVLVAPNLRRTRTFGGHIIYTDMECCRALFHSWGLVCTRVRLYLGTNLLGRLKMMYRDLLYGLVP